MSPVCFFQAHSRNIIAFTVTCTAQVAPQMIDDNCAENATAHNVILLCRIGTNKQKHLSPHEILTRSLMHQMTEMLVDRRHHTGDFLTRTCDCRVCFFFCCCCCCSCLCLSLSLSPIFFHLEKKNPKRWVPWKVSTGLINK